LEARGGIEPPIKVLQTFALPLGYRAILLAAERVSSSTLQNSGPKNKTHQPVFLAMGRNSGSTGIYALGSNLPAPEDTHAQQKQQQYICEVF
jgi:hypothetical protein